MGSDSDMPVMSKAAEILDKLGVEYEMKIISAHREPDVFFEYAKTAEEKGFKVIIAGAGMAAHLPGMCADLSNAGDRYSDAYNISGRKRFPLLNRTDAKRYPGCHSSDQWWCQCGTSLLPRSLQLPDAELLSRLKAYSQELKEQVEKKDARLQEVGYKKITK